MKVNFRLCVVFLILLLLQSCSRDGSKSNGSRMMTIEQNSSANTLFYSGTIQPLKSVVVTTPADGAVIEMPFQYGEHVKENQLLFVISSAKFLTDYKSALMAFIKAKSDFNNAENQLNESKFLHKNELVSDDEFKSKQASYYASQLALLQAKDTLESLLHQSDIKELNLTSLTIADVDKINQALHLQTSSENLRILAPASGVVLSPNKGEEENKKVAKGDAVKQSDALAVIGNMSGLSVRVKVNELTVNQIKVGQKVKVTGIAFPEHTLNGEITKVDRQGESNGGGLPNFTIQITVPHLTEEQQQMIHVGMSAKVEINIAEESQIMVPFAAVKEKKGNSYVQLYDASTKRTKEVAVKTGKTTMDSVAILAGLKPGDKIVLPD